MATTRRILHVFADTGVESEILSVVGNVVRIGLNPTTNVYDNVIQADANRLPLDCTFDLVFLQPECSRWSPLGNGDGPDQIELARQIGNDFGEDYIIENVPRNEKLKNPVRLYGSMFGLPISYQRIFETSFPTSKPPTPTGEEVRASIHQSNRFEKEWWQLVKGYSTPRARKDIVVKEGIPAPYVRWLLVKWLDSKG